MYYTNTITSTTVAAATATTSEDQETSKTCLYTPPQLHKPMNQATLHAITLTVGAKHIQAQPKPLLSNPPSTVNHTESTRAFLSFLLHSQCHLPYHNSMLRISFFINKIVPALVIVLVQKRQSLILMHV